MTLSDLWRFSWRTFLGSLYVHVYVRTYVHVRTYVRTVLINNLLNSIEIRSLCYVKCLCPGRSKYFKSRDKKQVSYNI